MMLSLLVCAAIVASFGGAVQGSLESSMKYAHNYVRKNHQNTPDVAWDSDLAAGAQSWAEHIASLKKMEHASSNSFGENIFWGSGYQKTADYAVYDWYEEINNYNFDDPSQSGSSGHFTQVVWAGSTSIGCGSAPGKATIQGKEWDGTYIVCRYTPAGNMKGQYESNVFAVIDESAKPTSHTDLVEQ